VGDVEVGFCVGLVDYAGIWVSGMDGFNGDGEAKYNNSVASLVSLEVSSLYVWSIRFCKVPSLSGRIHVIFQVIERSKRLTAKRFYRMVLSFRG
jgi:hypothetical protein